MSLVDDFPHRRFNPLLKEWVLVSPHRTKRPWLGQVEPDSSDARPAYDPKCFLCPGNVRANGEVNPAYADTYNFVNDFSAVLADTPSFDEDHDLFRLESVRGECRVICFSPRHDLTLAEMAPDEILSVIRSWKDIAAELGETYKWVQIFENKGAIMGCSNPHPHGQVWAGDWIPTLVSKEDSAQREYFEKSGQVMLVDYALSELEKGERVISSNEHWVSLVPFWALWPFETMVLPRRHVTRVTELTEAESESLASILKDLLVRYDNLFSTSFPYSMGWHGAPFMGADSAHWQLHAHFYPPLLRSASVKKFMVGYEMLGEPQRDITSEQAADRLRACSTVHYRG